MIQRTQSLYLAGAVILLLIVTLGTTIFNFQGEAENMYLLNASGVKLIQSENLTTPVRELPFYIGGLILILMCFITLIMYKNLKRQLSVARLTAFVYFMVLVALGFAAFLGTYFTKEEKVSVSLGIGFYMIVLGFPLVLLAIRGIKKDKALIDSVNRLR